MTKWLLIVVVSGFAVKVPAPEGDGYGELFHTKQQCEEAITKWEADTSSHVTCIAIPLPPEAP